MSHSDQKYSFIFTAHLSAVVCVLTVACGNTKVPVAATTPKPPAGTYIDLEPSWRLRVITPLVAGGGYVVKTVPAQEQGNTIKFKTGQDFLGYETAYYDVRQGLNVRFANAQVTRGKVDSATQARASPLPDGPWNEAHAARLPRTRRWLA